LDFSVTKHSQPEESEELESRFEQMRLAPCEQLPVVKEKEMFPEPIIYLYFTLEPALDTPKGPTPIMALDCEMVIVDRTNLELARCSIVNYYGNVLLDTYIKPVGRITNYVPWITGITYVTIKHCKSYVYYEKQIKDLLDGRIIVGHSLHNDFKALSYKPHESKIRDLTKFKPLNGCTSIWSLKKMMGQYLHGSIQKGTHDSVEDARAAMALYRKFESDWEGSLK